MTAAPLLEEAIALALHAHAGQVDKAGAPYLLHPLRVMLRFRDLESAMVGVLHDVVEDSPLTLAELRQKGFPEPVVAAVEALTHRPEEGYEAFIQRLKVNPLARRVKLADLEDNMDIRRLRPPLQPQDLERLQRYRRAWDALQAMESGGS